jgi:SAM-dependent methyltransferase
VVRRRDVFEHNRETWNRQVSAGNRWTVPVDPSTVARAQRGDWSIVLTPSRPVPRAWFPEDLGECRVLALASGGGQQGPILAAAGARVTVFDASEAQLARDREVAARDGLDLQTIHGDMADLGCFQDEAFDLVVHPVSNCFVPDVTPVWREVARVLRPGGVLLAGVVNPVEYALDEDLAAAGGPLVLKHPIPHSDAVVASPEEIDRRLAEGEMLEFGHSLENLLGGQGRAGLAIVDLYEDAWGPQQNRAIATIMPTFIATRAVRWAMS